MIELKNIRKTYNVGGQPFNALDDINITIGDGEFVAITGASGSGKTTLLNILGCLDTPDEGSYILDGEDVGALSDAKQAQIRNSKIGFVFQDFALIEKQSVLYNVMLTLLFGKTLNSELKNAAMAALEKVEIKNQAAKKANQLSGGQKQRVAIARAIVTNPSILLADEPTGQLDSKIGSRIIDLLTELNKTGITVILVTHDQGVAARAARQISLSDGKIV